jgi:hypothetical protein
LFEAAVDYALAQLRQSTDENLLGFEIDADAAIAGEGLLLDGTVRRRDDPRRRLQLVATLSEKAATLIQAEDAMWRVWRLLAYGNFQATTLVRAADAVTLSFLTSAPGLCVTGDFRVGGRQYERLFRKNR